MVMAPLFIRLLKMTIKLLQLIKLDSNNIFMKLKIYVIILIVNK